MYNSLLSIICPEYLQGSEDVSTNMIQMSQVSPEEDKAWWLPDVASPYKMQTTRYTCNKFSPFTIFPYFVVWLLPRTTLPPW